VIAPLESMHAISSLIVIPARGGSKRLPRKNLRRLGGRSLMQRADDAVRAAGIEAPRLLTTDDTEIAEEGRRLGWLVPFLRPAELATDDTPTLPAVMHAVDWYRDNHGGDPELVLLLQLTSPFRRAETLRNGFASLADDPEADAIVGVLDTGMRAEHVFERAANGYLEPLRTNAKVAATTASRTARVPSGVMFLIRTGALRQHGTFFPPATREVMTDAIESIDIDTEIDWRIAEALVDRGLAR